MEKIIIYQIFTRLFGNKTTACIENGKLEENGCGKFCNFTPAVLKRIKDMGVTHVWYTGVIRHASATDYSKYGIPCQNPDVVKGKAGSPYAITDYYDVDPDLASDVERRMEEFEALVERTHKAGMKVIIRACTSQQETIFTIVRDVLSTSRMSSLQQICVTIHIWNVLRRQQGMITLATDRAGTTGTKR